MAGHSGFRLTFRAFLFALIPFLSLGFFPSAYSLLLPVFPPLSFSSSLTHVLISPLNILLVQSLLAPDSNQVEC